MGVVGVGVKGINGESSGVTKKGMRDEFLCGIDEGIVDVEKERGSGSMVLVRRRIRKGRGDC